MRIFLDVFSVPTARTHWLTQAIGVCSSQYLKVGSLSLQTPFLYLLLSLSFGLVLSSHTGSPPFALFSPSSQNYVATLLFSPQLLVLQLCLPSLGQQHFLSFPMPSWQYSTISCPFCPDHYAASTLVTEQIIFHSQIDTFYSGGMFSRGWLIFYL